MSYTFLNDAGNVLNQNDLIEKSSLLLSGEEVSFNVYTDEANSNTGIYLKVSSFLGEISLPGRESVYKDFADLLHWGSDTSIDAGLEVKTTREDVETWIKFSFENGSSYNNKIALPEGNLESEGTFVITLRFKSNPNVESRRLFIGVEIDDS